MTGTMPVPITTWTDVAGHMSDLLALTLVATGLGVAIALRVFPRIVRAVKAAFRG